VKVTEGGREGSEGQSHKKEERQEGVEWKRRVQGPLPRNGRLYWIFV